MLHSIDLTGSNGIADAVMSQEIRIVPSKVTSTRTMMDLLGLRLPFNQLQLLTVDEFLKGCPEKVDT